MSVKQNILLHSANKNSITDLNNDINIRFPDTVFRKAPVNIELINFNIMCETGLFGNTNNSFNLEYVDDNENLIKTLIIFEFNIDVKTDEQLAELITTQLNNLENSSIQFLCTPINIINVITGGESEVDSSTCTYNLSCDRPCTFDFNVKDSIGPLLGFGNGKYENVTIIEGTSTQSIDTYNYVSVYNESYDTGIFPNYNDINCKMMLYDSSNQPIINIDNPDDTTISIVKSGNLENFKSIGDILFLLKEDMNRYSDQFSPPANFNVTFDYEKNKVTITNTTGQLFGIGFNFFDDNILSSGSMHRILGFDQKKYSMVNSITSINECRIFENVFVDDYILLCSDIVGNNSDINILGISNGNNIKSNQILFAIPFKSNSFSPFESHHYKINLDSSRFSKGYRERTFNDNNPNLVNFYLRLLSGRHIKSTSSWNSLLSIMF